MIEPARRNQDGECIDMRCRRYGVSRPDDPGKCAGYHCPHCDAPTGMMGHRCPKDPDPDALGLVAVQGGERSEGVGEQ